jgi:hypothetical protein
MTEKTNALDDLRYGVGKTQEYARQALPILVRWAECQSNLTFRDRQEHTYQEVAANLVPPTHQRPIARVLGLLGRVLNQLGGRKTQFGEIPPIQLLVWKKGEGRPGDSGLTYSGKSLEAIRSLTNGQKRAMAAGFWQEVIDYPHWHEVLRACGLEPLTVELPDLQAALRSVEETCKSREESEAHRKLKVYVKDNYHLLGVSGQFDASNERLLLSADRVDVFLEGKGKNNTKICVEVKSRLSPAGDLLRGIFQCVKYRAVLGAHNTYQMTRDGAFAASKVSAILVTEKPLPSALEALCKQLAIPHKQIVVP